MDFILLAAHEIECQFFTDLLGSWRTVDMPQRPDAMISDNEGNRLYSGTLDTAKNTG